MGLFSKKEKIIENPPIEKRSFGEYFGGVGVKLLYTNDQSQMSINQALNLSSVSRAVSLISNTVAELDFLPYRRLKDGSEIVDYQHISYNVLNKRPNKIHNRFSFFKVIISNVLLHGNAYILLKRDNNGDVLEQYILDSTKVTPYSINNQTDIVYKVQGYTNDFNSEDIIHIKNIPDLSQNGMVGLSTLKYASNILTIATHENDSAKGWFAGGSNLSGILKLVGNVTEEKKKAIKNAWEQAFTPTVGKPASVAILDGNMEFSPVSVSPADSQMLESRQFSVYEVARFFNIPPNLLFADGASGGSNSEQDGLNFLSNCIQPILEQIENEYYKLFRPSERPFLSARFDLSKLMKTDLVTKADFYSKLFMVGGLTINDIRRNLELKTFEQENCNKPYVQSSMLPADFVVNQSSTTTTTNQTVQKVDNIDNKAKM